VDGTDHAAVAAHAVQVGVAEDVTAAVHPWCLAVPHADDPVVAVQRREVVLLAAPDRGGGQVLVHPRDPVHVVFGQQRAGTLQRLVEAAQRRARVAAALRGGVLAAPPVGADLVEKHPDERLHSGEEDATVGNAVLRVQPEVRNAGGGECHAGSSAARIWSLLGCCSGADSATSDETLLLSGFQMDPGQSLA
jgi:hypothetical protein